MKKALRAYHEVLRLVRRLPPDSRGYYAEFARKNFINYRDVDPDNVLAVEELLKRTYTYSVWILGEHKVRGSVTVAGKLKENCYG